MMNYNIRKDETEGKYIYRICSQKDVIGSWREVASIINKNTGRATSPETYKREYNAFLRIFEANKDILVDGTSMLESIETAKHELAKERYKYQTEKNELAMWLRENARDELIVEKIVSAINQPFEVTHKKTTKNKQDAKKEYVLIFADEHFGSDFEIKAIDGRIINKYNPEIFYERMNNLLAEVVDIVSEKEIDVLNVFSLGDFTDGILRVGQLQKLRYGVVDSTVHYMKFIASWLNELSEYVDIKFYTIDGNHSELRMFNQPKGAFKDENMGKVVLAYLEAVLADNKYVEIVKSHSNTVYANLCGFDIAGIHGECKNMERQLKDMIVVNNVNIDYLISGHLHHESGDEVGVNKGVIRTRSICGVDSFAHSINKTSCAGASIIEFTEGKGKTLEYSINLQ